MAQILQKPAVSWLGLVNQV